MVAFPQDIEEIPLLQVCTPRIADFDLNRLSNMTTKQEDLPNLPG
jgi:hypothetical protein